LALDAQTAGRVKQHHAGGDLVDVLAALALRGDEGFLQIVLANAKPKHAPLQRQELLLRDREDQAAAHGTSSPSLPPPVEPPTSSSSPPSSEALMSSQKRSQASLVEVSAMA